MNLIEFVKNFLSCVKHNKGDEIFLTSGLIDFYNEITETNGTKLLKWEHFTTFIIENVIEVDMEDHFIPSKFVSSKTPLINRKYCYQILVHLQ
jgi:hypothetical protein